MKPNHQTLLLSFLFLFIIGCSSIQHSYLVNSYKIKDVETVPRDSLVMTVKKIAQKLRLSNIAEPRSAFVSNRGVGVGENPFDMVQNRSKGSIEIKSIDSSLLILMPGTVVGRVISIRNDTLRIHGLSSLSEKRLVFPYPVSSFYYSEYRFNDVLASCIRQELASNYTKLQPSQKSKPLFIGYSLLSPAFGTIYCGHNNPLKVQRKYNSDVALGALIDLLGGYLLLRKDHESSTKRYGGAILLAHRLMYLSFVDDIDRYNRISKSYAVELTTRDRFVGIGVELIR